jgi:hypothetical protein
LETESRVEWVDTMEPVFIPIPLLASDSVLLSGTTGTGTTASRDERMTP